MGLCPLDLYSHSLTCMLMNTKIDNISIAEMSNGKDVIHTGAQNLIEFGIYTHFNVKRGYYFECNEYVFPELLERIGNKPGHQAFLSALWSEQGKELDFHFYRDMTDGAGSLFENEKFESYVPDCPMLNKTLKVKTNTLDNFIQDGIVDISDIIFWNNDTQGAELEIFKGGNMLLNSPSLKFIWCEISFDNLYKNAPLADDITQYLKQFGFVLVGVRDDGNAQGDGLYVRV